MNVTVCSIFRNSMAYLDRYFDQIGALEETLGRRGDSLSLVWGEGDSTDDTLAWLLSSPYEAKIVDCAHGGPAYTSVVDAQRFKQLAFVGNRVLANVPDDADAVVYIESDLIWEPQTIIELLNDIQWRDVVAPLIMHKGNPGLYKGDGPFFYDRYAFIKDGIHFTNEPPYHEAIDGNMTKMDSVGSVLAMNAKIARNVRLPEEDVIVGFCRLIREQGGSIWLDPHLAVYHE